MNRAVYKICTCTVRLSYSHGVKVINTNRFVGYLNHIITVRYNSCVYYRYCYKLVRLYDLYYFHIIATPNQFQNRAEGVVTYTHPATVMTPDL